jgi:2'-5' RNA ligase
MTAPSSPPDRTHRLFFALWPDPALQHALAEATRTLVHEIDATPVPEQNFHLTLAFVGSVPESRLEALAELATNVSAAFRANAQGSASIDNGRTGHAPIVVTLDRIEHWRDSGVLTATSSTQSLEAVALANILKAALAAKGFPVDHTHREFRSHATLARKVQGSIPSSALAPVLWSFREFALVESQRGPHGSVYHVLASYPLR